MPRIRAGSIEEHKSLTRREVLDAASALFRAQGYTDTSLGDIAGYVGIGRTTLYEYFADKEDILVHLVEETMPEVMSSMLRDLPGQVRARERLAELIVRGLEFVSSDVDLGSLIMRELPKLSPAAQRRVRNTHHQLLDEVTGVCRIGIEQGEFRPFDAEEAGRLVYAMMMSASQVLLRDDEAKQNFHDAADTVVRFVFDGLALPE